MFSCVFFLNIRILKLQIAGLLYVWVGTSCIFSWNRFIDTCKNAVFSFFINPKVIQMLYFIISCHAPVGNMMSCIKIDKTLVVNKLVTLRNVTPNNVLYVMTYS